MNIRFEIQMILIGVLMMFGFYLFANIATCSSDSFSIARYDWKEMACYSTGYYQGKQLSTWKTDIWFNSEGLLSKEQAQELKKIGMSNIRYYDLKTERIEVIQ